MSAGEASSGKLSGKLSAFLRVVRGDGTSAWGQMSTVQG